MHEEEETDLSGFGEKETSSVDFVTLVMKRILFFSFFNQLPSINYTLKKLYIQIFSYQYEI